MKTLRFVMPRRYRLWLLLCFMLFGVCLKALAASPTTELHISKVGSDNNEILEEMTVQYQWLSDPGNIPVLGDGVTVYYHQGPVFVNDPDPELQARLRWNEAEDTNIKEMGALRGTNLKDLCELVGGMNRGDRVRIKAADGLSRTFAYKNVYQYSEREGPMVICWERDGATPESGYRDGMRLVWFADTSQNPLGQHVFGNWDWHEAADEQHWYFFLNGPERYPTTTGLSIQSVSEITIIKADTTAEPEPPVRVPPKAAFTAETVSGDAPLRVIFVDESLNQPTSWTWDFDGDKSTDSTEPNPVFVYEEPGQYSVTLKVSNEAGHDEVTKNDYILVHAKETDPAAQDTEPEAETLAADEAQPTEPTESAAVSPAAIFAVIATATAILIGVFFKKRAG